VDGKGKAALQQYLTHVVGDVLRPARGAAGGAEGARRLTNNHVRIYSYICCPQLADNTLRMKDEAVFGVLCCAVLMCCVVLCCVVLCWLLCGYFVVRFFIIIEFSLFYSILINLLNKQQEKAKQFKDSKIATLFICHDTLHLVIVNNNYFVVKTNFL
jgi:hypothetical protein